MNNSRSTYVHKMFAKFRIENCLERLKQRYPEFSFPLNGLTFIERTEENSCPDVLESKLSTDGQNVYYSPYWVNKNRLHEMEAQIMHIVLHGILGHFLHQQEYPKHEYRDPLMDAQITQLMGMLGLGGPQLKDTLSQVERTLTGDFSTKQYYRALRDPTFGNELRYISWALAVDDHREWNYNEEVQKLTKEMSHFLTQHQKEVRQFWKSAMSYFAENPENENSFMQVKSMIEKLAALHPQSYDSAAGTDTNAFLRKNRPVRNYRELLQEFFTVRETTKEQPDTFDPMFYHYGLDLYTDVPLIEPLEHGEIPAPKRIVIAVDVSGSCMSKDIMEKFWGETYGCISQFRESANDGEIVIIQCDAKIQKEERLLLSEFTETPDSIQVIGNGGTDFIPVFRRIEELIQEGETVDALLYLTDGYGNYPEEAATVPTYFVLPEPSGNLSQKRGDIPEWIELVYLEDEK